PGGPLVSPRGDFRQPLRVASTFSRNQTRECSTSQIVAALESNGQESVLAVWTAAARPVRVALGDATSGKVFLFGPDGSEEKPGGRSFYFELAVLPRPQAIEAGKLKPVDVKNPLEAVLERAQQLKALKIIK